jgi:hypothetical protein
VGNAATGSATGTAIAASSSDDGEFGADMLSERMAT